MEKNTNILIRLPEELKEKSAKLAKLKGVGTLSGYVRFLLAQEVEKAEREGILGGEKS